MKSANSDGPIHFVFYLQSLACPPMCSPLMAPFRSMRPIGLGGPLYAASACASTALLPWLFIAWSVDAFGTAERARCARASSFVVLFSCSSGGHALKLIATALPHAVEILLVTLLCPARLSKLHTSHN